MYTYETVAVPSDMYRAPISSAPFRTAEERSSVSTGETSNWGSSNILCYIILSSIISYHIISYHIISSSILFYPLGPTWVGFRLCSRSRKWFKGFGCPEKRLIYYVSYYVKVRGAKGTSDSGSKETSAQEAGALFGRHYLSKAACLIRPHSFSMALLV